MDERQVLGNPERKSRFDPNLSEKLIKYYGDNYKPPAQPVEERKTPDGSEIGVSQINDVLGIEEYDGFEYVDSIKLYVSKKKELFSNNWSQCNDELHERGDRMVTPLEFVAFLNHLRGKNDDESNAILDEIYKVGGDWSAEWLDAKFEKQGKLWRMHYHVFGNGGIEERVQDLKGILMNNKTPGVDLDTWLSNNKYGLPKPRIKKGDLWYWCPGDEKVAWFGANSYRAVLGCGRSPDSRVTSLGVRAVRRPRKKILEGSA